MQAAGIIMYVYFFTPCNKIASLILRWQLEKGTCLQNRDPERAQRQSNVCLIIFVKKYKPRNFSEKI